MLITKSNVLFCFLFIEIGDIAGVADVTIRQSYRLIFPKAAGLFPSDFKFTTPVEKLPNLWSVSSSAFCQFRYLYLLLRNILRLLVARKTWSLCLSSWHFLQTLWVLGSLNCTSHSNAWILTVLGLACLYPIKSGETKRYWPPCRR